MSDKMVRIHVVSIPLTQQAIDRLQACVDSLDGSIIEAVDTDAADQNQATIIFDENLDK